MSQIGALERLLALVHVELRVDELQMRHFDFVLQISGIGAQRSLVLHQRRVVVLNLLGVPACVVIGIALRTPG